MNSMDMINYVLDVYDQLESDDSDIESDGCNENEASFPDSNINHHNVTNDNIEVGKSHVDNVGETMNDSMLEDDKMTAEFDDHYSSDESSSSIDSELTDFDVFKPNVSYHTANQVIVAVINTIIDKAVSHHSVEIGDKTSDYTVDNSSDSNAENVIIDNLEDGMDTDHANDANSLVKENDIEINILSEAEIQKYLKKIFNNCESIINSSLCKNIITNAPNEEDSMNHGSDTSDNDVDSVIIGNQEPDELLIASLSDNDNDMSQDDNSDDVKHSENVTDADTYREANENPNKRRKLMATNLLIEANMDSDESCEENLCAPGEENGSSTDIIIQRIRVRSDLMSLSDLVDTKTTEEVITTNEREEGELSQSQDIVFGDVTPECFLANGRDVDYVNPGIDQQTDEVIIVPQCSDITDTSIEDSFSGESLPEIQPVISKHSYDWRWLEAIKNSNPAIEDQKPEIKISTADILQNIKEVTEIDNSNRVLKPKNDIHDKLENELRNKLIKQTGKITNKRRSNTSNSSSQRFENTREPNIQFDNKSVSKHPKQIPWQPTRAVSIQSSGHGKNRNLDGPSGSQSKSRFESSDNRGKSLKLSSSQSKSTSNSWDKRDRSPLRKKSQPKSKSRDRFSKSKCSPRRKRSYSSQSKSRSKSREYRRGSRRRTRDRSSSVESYRSISMLRNSQEEQFEEERRITSRPSNNKKAKERMDLNDELTLYFSTQQQQGSRKRYERQNKENGKSREASVFNRLGPPQ